jgi:DNA-binding NarL/FixJ family response regulator
MKKQAQLPRPVRKTKVLLIDDHPILRAGLAERINHEADMEICAEAGTAFEAMQAIAQTNPDVAIVDISLEDSHGLGLIKDIKIQYPKLAMLVFSMHDENLYAERALHAGARGYVMKQEAPQTVLNAIRRVLLGDIHLSADMTRKLLGNIAGGRQVTQAATVADELSDREYEVFELIGRGFGTMEIARMLHLSAKTISAHRQHIKQKLGIPDGAALLRLAIQCITDGDTGHTALPPK